jgi:hypothetical protein
MRFLSIYTPAASTAGVPPSKEHMERMGKLIEESMKAGWLLETGAMLPISKGGARVRSDGRQITVLDGPFAEAKEVIAGYALLEAQSREEVIGLVKQFLEVAGKGECDVQQIMEPDADFARP